MTIGIKYCGGCNQRYERTHIVRDLKRDFPRSEIVPAGEDIDYAVVICGCMSACALHDTLEGRYGKTIITEQGDYAQLKQELMRIENKIEPKN
ncbi:MAG: hypothetical protein VB081_13025 [Christensenella sp.]|uniref:hypothetical protein n=1 Tax=Christensenella sp. TaxID=1935934 RepID=UPI002B213437|nr:hypothetical protein [Christensenella sp.]MEA5004401.1 hypothetical protein [Christensenella sp.]